MANWISVLFILQVLVEYDDFDWKKREWIKVYEDNAFHIFLIESTLVWATREDPHSPGRKVQWPALVSNIFSWVCLLKSLLQFQSMGDLLFDVHS